MRLRQPQGWPLRPPPTTGSLPARAVGWQLAPPASHTYLYFFGVLLLGPRRKQKLWPWVPRQGQQSEERWAHVVDLKVARQKDRMRYCTLRAKICSSDEAPETLSILRGPNIAHTT